MRPKSAHVAVVGSVVSALLGLAWACSGSQQSSALVRCQLDALKVLPEDVGMITVYDAIDIYERVHACHRQHTADAGAP